MVLVLKVLCLGLWATIMFFLVMAQFFNGYKDKYNKFAIPASHKFKQEKM